MGKTSLQILDQAITGHAATKPTGTLAKKFPPWEV
jgi:hypothetical protein